MILSIMDVAVGWAHRLGLAISPLFPSGIGDLSGEHHAMLDGRRASFACSIVEQPDIPQESSRNWQWSADLAHHVLITPTEVQVRSGGESLVRSFRRDSVESQLEEFLRFLDTSQRAALPDVVSFLVEEFRGIWATNPSSEGHVALAAFLFALYAAGKDNLASLDDPNWIRNTALSLGIDDPSFTQVGMNKATINRARGMLERAPLGLQLVPSLVLRHAAGRLFQEAHAILESAQLNLFGDASITTAPTYSPTGAYFTPVPIARLLADWALQVPETLPSDLTIADFACGSGVFLTEALRSLERRNFKGTVHLIGRDRSASAITMARFAVGTVERDMPDIQIDSDICQSDAFNSFWPKADIVLMNPPFRSWERMNNREREWVQAVTSDAGRGRPDLSVGFIERATHSLNTAGVLATLVPAGVLAGEGLSKWRNALIQRMTPSLIAVLGEHGLFQHALVNVGILGLQNGVSAQSRKPLCVGWSSAEAGAASRTIRAIRRWMLEADNESVVPRDDAGGWSLNITSLAAWKQRPSWLPGPGALGRLLELIQTRTATKVSDLFHVRQGIRTGANEVFLQPQKVVSTLPKNEQRYFREAVDAASFVDGEIKPQKYLFIPDPEWKTELDIRRAVPEFFKYLQMSKGSLGKRKSLLDDAERWWKLTRARGWTFQERARLISKRFGLYPAFARDFEGRLAVVQANAWIPTDALHSACVDEDALREVLTAYWWLLNSRVAVALLREYCPNVAGGQLDLENKYVKHIPLPNLATQFRYNPALQMLASAIRTSSPDRLPKLSDRDRFAAAAFGTDVSEWNLTGLASLD